jgi:hypothetical protein
MHGTCIKILKLMYILCKMRINLNKCKHEEITMPEGQIFVSRSPSDLSKFFTSLIMA